MEFFSIYNKKILQSEGFLISLAIIQCSATKSELLQLLKPVSSDQHFYGEQKQRPRQCKVMQGGGIGDME